MVIFIIMLIYCIIFPKQSINASAEAIKLWAENVLPTLLPFFIISKVILYSDGIKYFAKFFKPITNLLNIPEEIALPYSLSILCGYPTGSRIISEMEISCNETLLKTAEICYSSSPIFIIGTVGTSMLKSTKTGIELYVIHICALLLYTTFTTFKHNIVIKEKITEKKGISASIADGIASVLNICGYMVLFAMINSVISNILPHIPLLEGTVFGINEFTSGISVLSRTNGSLPIISFLLSFGGICVISQCIGFLPKINKLHFILTRVILGCIASVLCIIYIKTALYVPVILTFVIIALRKLRRK